MNYELHPLCTLFPRMAGAEFEALIADIRENGQREPIILHEGMILDGGNRYRACIEAGVEPQFMTFGGGNLVAYVLSANLHRRHMTPGQQAAIVASAQDWAKAQTVGKPKSGNATGLDRVSDRAAASGASDKTQRQADKVAKANPDLAKKVAHGEVSLPAAVKQVTGQRPGPKPPALKVIEGGKDAAELAALRDRLAAVEAERDELSERLAEMAADLEGYMTASEGEKAAAAEIKRLKSMVRTVESQRDDWMRQCAEMKKQIKSLERRLGKVGAAA